jgi:tRNA(fMet)-specific endonuclease VapC
MTDYMFDTDALSFIINGKIRYYPSYEVFLRDVPSASQYTCAPVVGELYAGAHKKREPHKMIERIRSLLSRLVIHPFDRREAEIYGAIRAQLEQQGKRLDDMDLSIAACALAHNMTLVTGNEKPFSRIPKLRLKVIGPRSPRCVREPSDVLYQVDKRTRPKKRKS